MLRSGLGEAISPVRGIQYFMALVTQDRGDQLAAGGIVIHDQYFRHPFLFLGAGP